MAEAGPAPIAIPIPIADGGGQVGGENQQGGQNEAAREAENQNQGGEAEQGQNQVQAAEQNQQVQEGQDGAEEGERNRRRVNPNPWNVTYEEVTEALRQLALEEAGNRFARRAFTGTQVSQWLRRNLPEKYDRCKIAEIRTMVLRHLRNGTFVTREFRTVYTNDRYQLRPPLPAALAALH